MKIKFLKKYLESINDITNKNFLDNFFKKELQK